MTVVVIGPVTRDLIINGNTRESKIGGASYFQSYVFEKYCPDYICIINCADYDALSEFPDSAKVRVLEKDDTHYYINRYLSPDLRIQSSNFADIPISVSDLEDILADIEEIDAFVLNPLNSFDFPLETVEYLKSFDADIYISLQGFLRQALEKTDEDAYSIDLKLTQDAVSKISDIDGLFLDEAEASILFKDNSYNDFNISQIVITNASKGSRIIADRQYKIDAVKCDNIADSTGCGDTFMAAYISKKLKGESITDSANFASKIASDKLKYFGPIK